MALGVGHRTPDLTQLSREHKKIPGEAFAGAM